MLFRTQTRTRSASLRRLIALLIVGAAALSVSAVASAKRHGKGKYRMLTGPALQGIGKRIGLTPAQIKKIQQIAIAAKRKMIWTKAKVKLAKLDIRAAMNADKPNRNKIMALAGQMGKHKGDLKKQKLAMKLDIRAAISPEQWRKLHRHLHKRGWHKKGGGPRHHGWGHGRRRGRSKRGDS